MMAACLVGQMVAMMAVYSVGQMVAWTVDWWADCLAV
jgi:hypothetical protein